MTDANRPSYALRSVIAAAGAFALVLGLLPLAPSAQAFPPGERDYDTDGQATTASDPYPDYESFPGSPGNVVERDAEDGLPATDRYRGVRRHDTAGQIAADDQTVQGEGFHDADEAIIARADKFPDSLAGSYMSGHLDAPILLVDTTGSIEENTEAALEVIDPQTITVLGGQDAVSDQAANDAAALGSQTSTIERFSGPTRFETAEEIADANQVAEHDGDRTAFLATGLEFADALAAGQLSFQGHPILLTGPDDLHAAADRAIDNQNIEHMVILGGQDAISSSVESEVEAKGVTTERVGDADRAGTATKVAQMAIDEFGFSADHMSVATGFRFPDALTAGPHAGKEQNPLFLARGTTFLDGAGGNDTQPSEFLDQHACDTESIHIAGGHAAISEDLEDTIRQHSECAFSLSPQSTANFADDTAHTVTAELPETATADTDVRFEVYRDDGSGSLSQHDSGNDTISSGESEAEFNYSHDGSTTADDRIVACFVEAGDSPSGTDEYCAEITSGGDDLENFREDSAEATKSWVEATGETAVQLNWQNEVGSLGAVDDTAARMLDDDGNGLAELRWNSDAGLVEVTGETITVTSEIPDDGTPAGANFHIHEESITANGGVVVSLPTPEFSEALTGDDAGATNPDNVDFSNRDLYEYELGGRVQDPAFSGPLSDMEDEMEAASAGDPIGYYLNVHTVDNGPGELRGQLQGQTDLMTPLTPPDGGLSELPAVYKAVAETDTGTTDVEVTFDVDVEEDPDPTVNLESGDFEASINGDPNAVGINTVDPTPGDDSITVELDTGYGSGDDVTVEILDSGAAKIVTADPARDGLGFGDVSESVRVRSFIAP